jgi:hypothetical protein
MNGSSVDLTMVCGTLKRQLPFYKGIWGVEVGADVMRRCFVTVLLDAERDEGGASVTFEARWYRQYRSVDWSSSRRLRLWQVSRASSVR